MSEPGWDLVFRCRGARTIWLNCPSCGGKFDGGSLHVGETRTCTACKGQFRFVEMPDDAPVQRVERKPPS